MNLISAVRARRSGIFPYQIAYIELTLMQGKPAIIMAIKEDENYIKRVVDALKGNGLIVEWKTVTRKEPYINTRMKFDEFGEPCGTEILPQEDVFAGWALSLKEIVKPTHFPDQFF